MLIVHTPPYQPDSRGKIERFFRSTREQFLNNLDRKLTLSLEELNERLWAWLDVYHRTEHSSLDRYSLVTNDPEATTRVSNAFRLHFSSERVQETKPTTASEDFGSFGAEWGVPSVFWFVGGIDSDMYDKAKKDGRIAEIPTNHNPRFAPVIHPTLQTGVEAMVVAAEAWLSR